MAKIRFGVTYQNSGKTDFSDLPDYARRVEELGLDSIWVTENIISNAPALECLTALSFMAAHTSRLTIGTSVLLLPLRNPVLLAQTINSMDVLSGGRVALGVGVGDPSSDYAAYGGNLGERAGRSEEALEVIKKLWIEDSVTYNGRYFQLQDYTLLPRPTQKPHPPIYIGGTAEPVLRRTGRFANGLNPINQTPEQAAALFDRVEAYARQYGRDPSSMTRTLHIFMCLADSRKEADRIASEVFAVRYQTDVSPVADNPRLFGTPDEVSRHIQEFVDVGVTEFILNICYYPDQAISQAEIFAKEIMPQWR